MKSTSPASCEILVTRLDTDARVSARRDASARCRDTSYWTRVSINFCCEPKLPMHDIRSIEDRWSDSGTICEAEVCRRRSRVLRVLGRIATREKFRHSESSNLIANSTFFSNHHACIKRRIERSFFSSSVSFHSCVVVPRIDSRVLAYVLRSRDFRNPLVVVEKSPSVAIL